MYIITIVVSQTFPLSILPTQQIYIMLIMKCFGKKNILPLKIAKYTLFGKLVTRGTMEERNNNGK